MDYKLRSGVAISRKIHRTRDPTLPLGLVPFSRGSQFAVGEFGSGGVGADPIAPAAGREFRRGKLALRTRRFVRAVFRPNRWFAGTAARKTLAIVARMT